MTQERGWALALATVGVVVAIDQLTKAWVRATVDVNEHINVFFGLDLDSHPRLDEEALRPRHAVHRHQPRLDQARGLGPGADLRPRRQRHVQALAHRFDSAT